VWRCVKCGKRHGKVHETKDLWVCIHCGHETPLFHEPSHDLVQAIESAFGEIKTQGDQA
jgi:DNA-directed RNA polymerase subunit RPC12/RpoP